MVVQDCVKWNGKHQQRLLNDSQTVPAPNSRLSHLLSLHAIGKLSVDQNLKCLDLACGLGGNSFLMAEHGYSVDALDISDVAIDFINQKARGDNQEQAMIKGAVIDLDDYQLQSNYYDFVVVTYFLDRKLFASIKDSVKCNGHVFMETFYAPRDKSQDPVSCHANTIPSAFKLEEDELKELFSDWDIVHYHQDDKAQIQTILARKL